MSQESRTAAGAPGPLDEFLVRIGAYEWDLDLMHELADAPHIQSILNQNQLEQEEFVAQCMRDKGFEFPVPSVPPILVTERPAGSFVPAGSREWAERFGFGHSTENLPGRWSRGFAVSSSTNREGDRALEEITARQSEEERLEFQRALQNSGGELIDLAELTPETAREFGCRFYGRFMRAELHDLNETRELRELVRDGVPALLRDNLEIQELNVDWARCMIDSGHPAWSSPEETDNAFRDEWQRTQEPFDANLLVTWDWESAPDGPPRADHHELRAREIATAVASWDCREQVGYDEVHRRVEVELQHQFMEQHWLILEEWALSIEARRAEMRQGFTNRSGI